MSGTGERKCLKQADSSLILTQWLRPVRLRGTICLETAVTASAVEVTDYWFDQFAPEGWKRSWFLDSGCTWKAFSLLDPFWGVLNFSSVGKTPGLYSQAKLSFYKRFLVGFCCLQLMCTKGNRSASFAFISARLLLCRLWQMLLTRQMFILSTVKGKTFL